jgi:predicted dehydrogenase
MKRLAIVRGAALYHGRAFAGIINRYDDAAFREKGWPAYPTALADRARVTAVYDPDRDAAAELAAAAGIETVAGAPEEIVGQVDGVLVTDDGTLEHQRAALPFLKAGIPTFIDKPLSTDIKEAESIARLAGECGTPFFSASALRFAVEIADREALREQVGRITVACGVAPNELIYYGVHPLEAMVTLLGPDIESVVNVGGPGCDIVRLNWEGGRQGILVTREEGFAYTLELTLHGDRGHLRVPVSDSAAFYTRMLSAFVDMVETGTAPFPVEETLAIIRALVLAKQSLAEGGVEKCLPAG